MYIENARPFINFYCTIHCSVTIFELLFKMYDIIITV